MHDGRFLCGPPTLAAHHRPVPRNSQGDGIVDCNSKSLEEAKGKTPSSHVMRGEMQIMRLDDVGPLTDVKALKMDVKGHEHFVMQGAKSFFTRQNVWFMVIELGPMLQMPEGRRPVDFITDIIK